MKRLVLLSGVLAMVLSVTGCKPRVNEYWISNDKVTAYKAPSDNAPVVRDLYTFVPVKVVEKDSTGQWGRVRLNYLLFKKSAWLPLNQMVYCGSDNLDEEFETGVVKPETLQLYKSPKADKDNVRSSLQQNDTVQITAREGKWVHVRCLKYSYGKLDEPSSKYGWVAENQLQSIGTLTNEVLSAAETEKTNKIIDAQTEERFSPKMVKIHHIYAKACKWIGWATAAIVVLLLIPAHRRNKTISLLLMLLLGALLVFVGTKCVVPSWYFAFIIPLMVYVICVPLLYNDNTSVLFFYVYLGLTLLVSGYYLYFYTNIPKHDSILMYRIIQCVLLVGVCVFIAYRIWVNKDYDLCPHCGRYSLHEIVDEVITGTSVSKSRHDDTRHTGTSRKHEMGREIVTEHYTTTTYEDEVETSHSLITYKCSKCGKTFQRRHSWISSSKRRIV